MALLLASVGMFIALIHRIGLLQINRMLVFTGEQGRKVITTLYPSAKLVDATTGPIDFRALPRTQTLIHHGRPRFIQAIDVIALVKLGKESGGVIEMVAAVGDTVLELTPIMHVYGAGQPVDERNLCRGVEMGEERTFEQDPKYAIRLLADIAIKALSPAINDPTTAVQALDQIEDLLLRLGQRHLEIGKYYDSDDRLRLVVPFPTWDDLLRLAFDEISAYGATSVQVMRRMNALIADLTRAVPEERRATVKYWNARLKATIERSFADSEQRMEALKEDRQGLGVPRHDQSS
jgi:uncharacterized membrane protein